MRKGRKNGPFDYAQGPVKSENEKFVEVLS